jgi:hypothetical protein
LQHTCFAGFFPIPHLAVGLGQPVGTNTLQEGAGLSTCPVPHIVFLWGTEIPQPLSRCLECKTMCILARGL